MAKASITEFPGIVVTAAGVNVPVAPYPALARQVTDYTSTPGQSAAFSTSTRLLRITVTEKCAVLFGSNPTATAIDTVLLPNYPEYFGVEPGHKVSFIAIQ